MQLVCWGAANKASGRPLPFCYSWQDEKHPEVDTEHQDDLENHFAHDGFTQIQGSVYYHGAELDQHHHQERTWDLIFRQ